MATTTVNLGLSLDGLSNVDTAGKANGNTLVWNSTTNKWEDAATSSGITIGTTAISGGTVGRVLFEGAGNVVQQDSLLFWDNTNKRFGVGATPSSSVRLDVRAQGALSTDIAFRVRNSANTRTNFEVNGLGQVRTRTNSFHGDLAFISYVSDSATERDAFRFSHYVQNFMGRTWTFDAGTNGNIEGFQLRNDLSGNDQGLFTIQANNYCFGTTISVAEGVITERRVMRLVNGVAPSTSVTDGFKMYSADIVAGNAAPHFRTENGSIIKLFQGAALTASDGTLANAVTRIAELEARLKAHGLIA